jgi:hypothetical protein
MRVAVVGDVLNDAEVCVRGGGKRGCRIDFPIFLSSLVCYSTRTKKKKRCTTITTANMIKQQQQQQERKTCAVCGVKFNVYGVEVGRSPRERVVMVVAVMWRVPVGQL